jgi:outer membrane protein assembly factor BamE
LFWAQVKNSGTQLSMHKQLKFITCSLLIISLNLLQACSFPGVFKINVQQGNIVTQEMLDTLKPGMTKKQVYFVLGKPVVENTFNSSLENYVYTYQKAGGEIQQQTIKIFYEDDRFIRYEGTLLEDNPAY